jgi:hypothetical protein
MLSGKDNCFIDLLSLWLIHHRKFVNSVCKILVTQTLLTILLAQYCLVDCLYTKHPAMFFSHFMETIFVLNDYRAHPTYNQAPQSDKERSLFSLKGEEKYVMHNVYYSY